MLFLPKPKMSQMEQRIKSVPEQTPENWMKSANNWKNKQKTMTYSFAMQFNPTKA